MAKYFSGAERNDEMESGIKAENRDWNNYSDNDSNDDDKDDDNDKNYNIININITWDLSQGTLLQILNYNSIYKTQCRIGKCQQEIHVN